MRSAIVLLFCAYFMFNALQSSYAAMLLYWWFAIFRPQDWIYIDVSTLRLPLVAAFIFVVPTIFRGKIPRVSDPISLLMLSWVVLAGIAALTNGCNGIGPLAGAMTYMIILIFIVFLSERVIESKAQLLGLVATVGISLIFYSGKGGLAAIISGNTNNYGAANLTGLFKGSNAFALGTSILLFYTVFVYRQLSNKQSILEFPRFLRKFYFTKIFKYSLLILMIFSIYNVVTLFSRGAALALFVGIICYALLFKLVLKFIFFSTVVLVIGGGTLVSLPGGYTERIASIFADEDVADDSAKSRPHFWKVAFDMAQDNPLGVGPGCYLEYYPQYDFSSGKFGNMRSVHSSHFQILAETGFFGILTWVGLFFMTFKRLLLVRKRAAYMVGERQNPDFYKDLANCLICSQVAYIVGGAFYELAHFDTTWLTFSLCVALDRLQKSDIENYRRGQMGDL